jgi:hypothetical protein
MTEKWTELVYVAGPYRDSCEWLVKQNIRKAEDIGVMLWAWGWIPIVPHLNTAFFGGAYGLPDTVWLKGDLVIAGVCKRIVVVPGWRFSSGTLTEIHKAQEEEKPIYYWEKEKDRVFLRDYYREWED